MVHIVEVGPTFHSKLGAIAVSPDGSAWIAESDGVVRITPRGTIAEKRRPDDCLPCMYDTPDDIALYKGGIVSAGDQIYIGTAAGGIALVDRSAGDPILSPAGAHNEASPPPITLPSHGVTNLIASWSTAPDRSVWIVESGTNLIARLSPNGNLNEYDAGIHGSALLGNIVADARGNIWYDDRYYSRVFRRSADGKTTVFGNGLPVNSAPGMAVAAADGAVWFFQTLSWHERLTRIAADGTVREFAVPQGVEVISTDALRANGDNVQFAASDASLQTNIYEMAPSGALSTKSSQGCFIAVQNFICDTNIPPPDVRAAYAVIGPDGALWFSDPVNSRIGRTDRHGHTTYYSRGLTRWNSGPQYMTVGSDNAIWFTEVRDRIGRISMDGTIKEFSGLPARCSLGGIALGADGNIWFTLYHGNELARISPSGVVTRFRDGIYPSRGNDSAAPDSQLTVGPDGKMWFNESQGGRIASAVIDR